MGCGQATAVMPMAEGDRRVRDLLVAKFIAPARAVLGERACKRAAAARMTPDQLFEFMLDRPPAAADAAAGSETAT